MAKKFENWPRGYQEKIEDILIRGYAFRSSNQYILYIVVAVLIQGIQV